jgi:hypothetical protein
MKTFKEIKIQEEIDYLCSLLRQLDSHLFYPRSGHPQKYFFYLSGKAGIHISKYIRNSAVLEKFQAFTNQLDDFFIGIEYFQKNISFTRNEGFEIPSKYKDIFFINVVCNSLRSSLDILSKCIAWFYDMEEKEDLGFSYHKFIAPLKKHNNKLSQQLNILYKSNEFNAIKELRDSSNHTGKNQRRILYESTLERFKVTVKIPKAFNHAIFEEQTSLLFYNIKEITIYMIDDFCRFKLGYDSENDSTIVEHSPGNWHKL